MDVHSNAAVPLQDDFLFRDSMEENDGVSLEWLSMFVEECLSEQPLPTPPPPPPPTTSTQHAQSPAQGPKPITVPSKARTKRRKLNNHHTFLMGPTDPPLLPQAYWLADSELILPKKEPKQLPKAVDNDGGAMGPNGPGVGLSGPGLKKQEEELRRCTHCLSHKTPQWRAGPLGPKTLCNACGVRFKSGRLLPEYRPAKSPTFESYKHSNSHKKVMEMRMDVLSSHAN